MPAEGALRDTPWSGGPAALRLPGLSTSSQAMVSQAMAPVSLPLSPNSQCPRTSKAELPWQWQSLPAPPRLAFPPYRRTTSPWSQGLVSSPPGTWPGTHKPDQCHAEQDRSKHSDPEQSR